MSRLRQTKSSVRQSELTSSSPIDTLPPPSLHAVAADNADAEQSNPRRTRSRSNGSNNNNNNQALPNSTSPTRTSRTTVGGSRHSRTSTLRSNAAALPLPLSQAVGAGLSPLRNDSGDGTTPAKDAVLSMERDDGDDDDDHVDRPLRATPALRLASGGNRLDDTVDVSDDEISRNNLQDGTIEIKDDTIDLAADASNLSSGQQSSTSDDVSRGSNSSAHDESNESLDRVENVDRTEFDEGGERIEGEERTEDGVARLDDVSETVDDEALLVGSTATNSGNESGLLDASADLVDVNATQDDRLPRADSLISAPDFTHDLQSGYSETRPNDNFPASATSPTGIRAVADHPSSRDVDSGESSSHLRTSPSATAEETDVGSTSNVASTSSGSSSSRGSKRPLDVENISDDEEEDSAPPRSRQRSHANDGAGGTSFDRSESPTMFGDIPGSSRGHVQGGRSVGAHSISDSDDSSDNELSNASPRRAGEASGRTSTRVVCPRKKFGLRADSPGSNVLDGGDDDGDNGGSPGGGDEVEVVGVQTAIIDVEEEDENRPEVIKSTNSQPIVIDSDDDDDDGDIELIGEKLGEGLGGDVASSIV